MTARHEEKLNLKFLHKNWGRATIKLETVCSGKGCASVTGKWQAQKEASTIRVIWLMAESTQLHRFPPQQRWKSFQGNRRPLMGKLHTSLLSFYLWPWNPIFIWISMQHLRQIHSGSIETISHEKINDIIHFPTHTTIVIPLILLFCKSLATKQNKICRPQVYKDSISFYLWPWNPVFIPSQKKAYIVYIYTAYIPLYSVLLETSLTPQALSPLSLHRVLHIYLEPSYSW